MDTKQQDKLEINFEKVHHSIFEMLLTDAHFVPFQPWSNVEPDFAYPIAFYDRLIKSLVRTVVAPPPLTMLLMLL